MTWICLRLIYSEHLSGFSFGIARDTVGIRLGDRPCTGVSSQQCRRSLVAAKAVATKLWSTVSGRTAACRYHRNELSSTKMVVVHRSLSDTHKYACRLIQHACTRI